MITVSETGLQIDGDAIGFDQIETVAYLRRAVHGSGAIIDVLRRFEASGAGARVSVKLDGAMVEREEKEEGWRALVAASQEWIEPRLREQALEQIRDHGAPVRVAKVELRPDGFAWRAGLRAKRYPWSEFNRAYYAASRIRVMAKRGDGKEKQIGQMFTDEPNAVLLPKLMADCFKSFG